MTDPRTDWQEIDWTRHESVVTVDGRAVNLVDIGHGPVVLLIHGLGGTWQSWLENIPALARDHRVLAVDQPGFGGSDVLPADADFSGYVTTLGRVLELLDVSGVHVVGHSFGGLVSQELATRRPDLIASASFVSAGGVELSRTRLALVMGSLLALRIVFAVPGLARTIARVGFLRRALLSAAVHDPRSVTPQLALETIPRMSAPGFRTAVRFGTAALRLVDARRVTVPAAVIWGRYDRLIPLAAGEQLHRELADSRLHVLEAGHGVMFERPVEFNAVLRDFLESLTPARQDGTKAAGGNSDASVDGEEVAG